jgi:hypothetical protein
MMALLLPSLCPSLRNNPRGVFAVSRGGQYKIDENMELYGHSLWILQGLIPALISYPI